MNDDPTVKDVLNAAAELPKKVGKTVLEAKIPVGAVKSGIQFVMSHWLSGVLSLAVLVWVSSHYLSEMKFARYTCYGPRADFTLPNEPPVGIVINAAISISPISQAIGWWKLANGDGANDPEFDFQKFVDEKGLDISYLPLVAGADNFDHAVELVEYQRRQTISACIADKSWLTALVVFAHALVAYLLLLTIGRGRRWISEGMFGR
ncbi:MAG: hypothetical protein KGZ77_09055 [Rhodobacteraceae bacterium]|nr:hypothetical protein [Paracoccaceae bacterium]